MARFTHLTIDGQPVQCVIWDHQTQGPGFALVQSRCGDRFTVPHRDLFPLGSAEAQDILAEITGQDEAAAVADALEDRVVLARWMRCVEAARSSLQDAVAEVLSMAGTDGPGWAARRRLEKALVDAGERLATFGG